MKLSDRLLTVEAVILSHKDFGEADRIVVLFSRENGKIRTLAKGVRKMRSRKAAYLEPFMQSKVILARGKTFWIVTQADAVHQNLAIRDSLSKTAEAAYVMELTDRFSIEEEPSRALFRLLVDTLKRINDDGSTYNALRFFELQLLDQAGFRPDLRNCVGCGKTIIAQDQYFSRSKGGVLCPACGAQQQHPRRVSEGALRYLRHFQRSAYADLADVAVPQAVQKEMAALLQVYISSVIERRLNTPDFMRQIKRAGVDGSQVQ